MTQLSCLNSRMAEGEGRVQLGMHVGAGWGRGLSVAGAPPASDLGAEEEQRGLFPS